MKKKICLTFSFLIVLALVFDACAKPENHVPDNPDNTAAATAEPTREPTNFTDMTPSDGEEVVLVPGEIYSWYSGYKTEADYFSTAKITKPIGNNLPVPVTLSWSYGKDAESFTLTYGLKNDLSDGKTVETSEKSVILEDLFVSSEYFWQVTARADGAEEKSPVNSFKTADSMRLLNVQGLENGRDIGGVSTSFGLKILQGKAYRTGNLEQLSGAAVTSMNERYGIKTELDLRYKDEINGRKASPLGESVTYVNIPSSQYFQLFWNSYPGSFKTALKTFADSASYPIDFHCTVGKDRTGTLAAFIYALCGVDEVTIVRDYEATYLKNTQNPSVTSTCEERLGSYFIPFLEQMKRTFGTNDLMLAAERMAQYVGITTDEINSIRTNLLGEEYRAQNIETYEHKVSEIADMEGPYLSWEGSQIAADFIGKSVRENIGDFKASEDGTYVTVTASGTEGMVYPLRGNVPVAAAKVLAVKYRTNSLPEGSYFEIFVDSTSQDPTSGSNAKQDFITDGEWHVIIMNLTDIKRFNGKSARSIRLDLYNRGTKGKTIDYSFIGFFTDEEAARKYLNVEAEPTPTAKPQNTDGEWAWRGGKIAAEFFGDAQIIEGISEYTESADGTYTTLTAGAREGVVYYFRGGDFRAIPKILAARYRTKDLASDAYFEVFVDSVNDGVDGTVMGSSSTRVPFVNDGEWHDVIIDLPAKISVFNGEEARYLRVDFINRGVEGQTIDYQLFGLFDTVEEAEKFLE